ASHDTDPGVVGGDNYSTYHIDIPKDVALTGTTGHEFWVVAESSGYNYINIPGVSAPPASSPLASFWRFPLFVASESYNEPPTIITGVTGDASPFAYGTSTYNVTATDPDADPLTYSWTVSFGGTPVTDYDGVAGDGAGNLDVDFAVLEPAEGDEYDISCDVSDGIETVSATTLTVTASALIWMYDGDVDDGDMTLMSGGHGAVWTWLPSSDVWDENGNITTIPPYDGTGTCQTLLTPQFDLPDGDYDVRIEVTSSGSYPISGSYGLSSGFLGYSTDGGSNWTWNTTSQSGCVTSLFWLTDCQGTNFNWSTSGMYNLGLYSHYCLTCSYYGFQGTWAGHVYGYGEVAPFANPVTGDWHCDNGIKSSGNAMIGFNFNRGNYSGGSGTETGWQLHKVKLYAAPPPPPPGPEVYTCDGGTSGSYDSAYELTSYSSFSGYDDGTYYVSLPFTFNFAGQNYTYAYIEMNGGLSFGNASGWYYGGCPPGWMGWDWIWPVEGDQDTICNGEIRYGSKTVGGKDCFIVQFVNIETYYCSGSLQNYMIVLVNDSTQAVFDPWMVQYGSMANTGYQGSFNYQPDGAGTSCCLASSTPSNTSHKYGDW
ncbi:MAG: hypothetical protein NTY09_11995, partial [bacterium]|nr:hypothetical protein [bacterium]